MTRFSALADVLGAVLERQTWRLRASQHRTDEGLAALSDNLITSRGEVSVVTLADEILTRFAALDAEGRASFFNHIAAAFDPDPEAVVLAAEAYRDGSCPDALERLFAAAEPPRQELLRRLNTAPGGTKKLVTMREHLLSLLKGAPELARIDADFRHLLGSWFNRGFLVMQPIDWQSPAAILEKIIAYEAVHEIDSWEELRRRVEPPDRRCFAFFHPSMPDEPLIFVEVALTRAVPGSIQGVLAPDRETVEPEAATVAVFYSISNCQPGLAGVSFGAFLIKQVAADLAASLPSLETFVTLSPVPGLVRWLEREAEADPEGDARRLLVLADQPGWIEGAEKESTQLLRVLAARYFLEAKRGDGQPVDPVARFHLGNGAELADIHAAGDISAKGMAQSLGVMVNYLYRLDRIEANHEAYADGGEIAASRAVRVIGRS